MKLQMAGKNLIFRSHTSGDKIILKHKEVVTVKVKTVITFGERMGFGMEMGLMENLGVDVLFPDLVGSSYEHCGSDRSTLSSVLVAEAELSVVGPSSCISGSAASVKCLP